MNRGWRTGALAATLLGLGCAGTETGNPIAGKQKLTIVARASDPGVAAIDSPRGQRITAVWVSIGEVSLTPCATDTPRVLGEQLVAELISAPRTLEFSIDETFCGLRVAFARTRANLPDTAPTDLAGNAILIEGRRADDVPVQVVSLAPPDSDLQATIPITNDRQDAASFILAFDVSAAFRGVDVDGLVHDMVPRIDINPTTNSDRLRVIEGNLARAATLHADADADGVLDTDEETPISSHR